MKMPKLLSTFFFFFLLSSLFCERFHLQDEQLPTSPIVRSSSILKLNRNTVCLIFKHLLTFDETSLLHSQGKFLTPGTGQQDPKKAVR